MPDDVRPTRLTRPGLTWPSTLDASGVSGPTRNDVRAGRWRRTSHGLYVPVGTDSTSPEQRIVEAAARLPTGGAVTGWAALRWLGVRWCDGVTAEGVLRDVVLASMRADVRPQPGIDICAERLDPVEVVIADGVPVTTGVRSVCFEMRYAEKLREAVVAGDMALAAEVCGVEELTTYVDEHPGWTGIPQARDARVLVVSSSWSPQETRFRLIWELDAGLPRPLCNVPVFDREGHHVATPDLLDPVAALVGEYDGAHHLEPRQRRRDIGREAGMRGVGLEVVTMVAGDQHRPAAVVRRLHEARDRARWSPPAARAWTLEVPAGWRARDRSA